METGRSRPSWNIAKLNSPFHTVILVCLVALLSYLAPKLAGALLLHPQTVWPLWPGCALLVPVLLLVPRRIWPIVIPAAFAAFVLYDLQAGVPVRSIAWFIPADTVEVLIAAFGLSYFSDRMPRLNSLKALGKYLFFVALLAPFTAAFLSAPGIRSDYWTGWKICFFSEVLALVTLTPAILGWVTDGPAWVRKSRAYHLEFAGLMAGLVLLSYITFTIPESSSSPALLYSLVPFLLWAALRFGSMGVSSSVVVVAFLSIWGAVHGRGPFTNGGLFSSVLSLQLFLVFAAIPFMVLAALVEERKRVEEVLRESEERLRLAMEVGKLGGWEWDIKSGRNPWFGTRSGSVQDFWDRVHPENLGQLRKAMETARQNHGEFDQEFRVVWPDGTLRWLRSQGRFFYAPDGEPERMLGISKDITKRKQVEQALRQSEAELMEAQRLANVGSWRWDLSTDRVTWSEELYRIAGLDPGLPAVSYKEHSKLHTAESWDRLRRAVEEALRTGTPYELDLEMIRFDGARRWLIAKGEARRDSTGHVVQLRGTVHDVTERKRTEEALRESQERLRLAQEAVHVGVFEWDVQKNENHWSPELERIYGLTPGSFGGTYEAWIERVHPDDRKRFKWDDQRNVQEGGLFDSEYRIVRPSGEILWLYSRVNLSCDSAGRPVRMLGFAIDITERKAAEVALATISRRLIEAQEQERTRIARELHDDIGQRLALLIIELEQLRQNASDLPVEVRSCIGALQKQTAEIATDVQSMSHELHSSKLEYLGLAVAMRAFCKEFSDQQNVEVVFAQDKVPSTLPQDISLCLFRVLQEALQNAVKHSGVRRFDVELRDTSNELQLTVRDLGSGFDVGQAMKSRGLGLISMAERVKLVEGRLSIDSQPQRGTTIRASVPLNKVARASA